MTPTSSVRQRDRRRWWEIHDQDDYVCPDCGAMEPEVDEFQVHHIDREPGKIVALCVTCHQVRHGATRHEIDLDAWKEEFVALGGAD